MSLKDIWKKILAVVGILVAIWIISPIPEVSIIVGIFGGETLKNFMPRWLAWTLSLSGAVIGALILKYTGLLEKIKDML